MMISKEDVLKGKDDAELIEVKSLGGEIPFRPLTKLELNSIEKIEAKAYGKFETNEKAHKNGQRQQKQIKSEVNTKGIVSLEKMSTAEFEGKTRAIFLSINNDYPESDSWSEKDIQGLKGPVFDEMFEIVQKISGIDIEEEEEEEAKLEEAVDNFPED